MRTATSTWATREPPHPQGGSRRHHHHARRHRHAGDTGDGGPATAATLEQPRSIAVDDVGNVYFADWGTNTVRRVDTPGSSPPSRGRAARASPATAGPPSPPAGPALRAGGPRRRRCTSATRAITASASWCRRTVGWWPLERAAVLGASTIELHAVHRVVSAVAGSLAGRQCQKLAATVGSTVFAPDCALILGEPARIKPRTRGLKV